MEQNLVTKFDEVRMRVSEPQHMVGKMLAEHLYRKYEKKVVDAETGEEVVKLYTELVFSRGRVLTKDDVSRISFFQQAGEIDEVLVSNQIRQAPYDRDEYSLYYEVVVQEEQKHRLLLFARGIPMALQMAIDYYEQTLTRPFSVLSVKLADDYHVVKYEPSTPEEAALATQYHVVTITHWDENVEKNIDYLYLTKAKDADNAIDIIRSIIEADENKKQALGDYIIKSAKESPINDVVPEDFVKEYFKHAAVEDFLLKGESFGQRPA